MSDVAAIHSNGPDCAVCHGSGVPSTKNCLTAGCHPDKVDGAGNVVGHGYNAVLHTSTVAAQPSSGNMYPPPGTAYRFAYLSRLMTYGFTTAGAANGLVCGGCHNPELGPEHLDKSSSSSYGQGCGVCHAPGGPVDSLPPTGWDGTCTACHPILHGEMESKHSVDPSGCDGVDCHYGAWKPDYAANHNDVWWKQVWGVYGRPWVGAFPPNGCAITDCHRNATTVPTPRGCGEGSYCHPVHPRFD